MTAGEGDARHVAADAVTGGDGTDLRLAGAGGPRARSVAGEALFVVPDETGDERLVGIVAGDAADAGVGAVEALAELEAVGLEADIDDAAPAMADDGAEGAMTLAAEAGHLFGGESAEIGRIDGVAAEGGVFGVAESALMAAGAGYSGMKSGQGEVLPL